MYLLWLHKPWTDTPYFYYTRKYRIRRVYYYNRWTPFVEINKRTTWKTKI